MMATVNRGACASGLRVGCIALTQKAAPPRCCLNLIWIMPT